jgi:hypothetical protein
VPRHALPVAMRETLSLLFNLVPPFAKDKVAVLKQLSLSLQLETIEPQRLKSDVLAHLHRCNDTKLPCHAKTGDMQSGQKLCF